MCPDMENIAMFQISVFFFFFKIVICHSDIGLIVEL